MSKVNSGIEMRRRVWAEALTLPGQPDLRTSLVAELAEYLGAPAGQVALRCHGAVAELAQAWRDAAPATPEAVSAFYRRTEAYLYDLTWWHALGADDSALVQVEALETALACGARTALDFGSGIGSLGLLLARHGLAVTLAEINPRLTDYARWRFERRGLSATFLDPGSDRLSADAFDFIAAVDVLEHLPDPPATLGALAAALRPGGTLFVHLPSEPDPARPMHLWPDPAALLDHLPAAGLWLSLTGNPLTGPSSGATLILRRGEGPRYALNRGFDLLPDERGGILLSEYPLVARRLNPQAFGVLARLDGGCTAAGVVAGVPGLSLADVTAFLDDFARRCILTRRPPPPVAWPAVSIVIPAHGRPAETRACVESLLALDYPADRLEILVVDDASDPPLGPALAGLPVRLLRQEQNVGQSAARNLAAAEARGEILAFIDNDCLADPGWLRALVPSLDDPAVGIVGGRVVAPPPEGRVAAFEAVRSPLDAGATGGEVGPGQAVAYLPTCNFLVRRSVFARLQGFDAGLALGEDVDFTWRARRAGVRAHYVPEGRVVHRHRTRLAALLRRRADYGFSEADLHSRHPEGRRVMRVPPVGIALLAALVAWPVLWVAGAALAAAALAGMAVEVGRKWRRLPQVGLRLPARRVAGAVLREHGAALYHLGMHVVRYYSLPLLAAGLAWPPLLLAAAVLFLVPPVTDHRRLQPGLSLPAFTGLYWLEMGAYQVGVWRGCWRRRTLRPLLPRLQLG